MKKLIIALSLFFAIGIANPAGAQNININVNVDKQPAWGPTGYDYAEFYYFPDINIYFDVNSSVFHYLSGSKWVSNQYLPSKYSKYDLYNMYKVVVNDKQPWLQNKNHKKSYSAYKGNKTQQAIRYSSNSKYSNSKNNDRNWVNMNDFSNNNKGKNTNNSNDKGNNSNSNSNNKNKDKGSASNSHR
ncbi:MAG: hypothetical protein ACK5M3_09370 [Dysgonomonas sp.]